MLKHVFLYFFIQLAATVTFGQIKDLEEYDLRTASSPRGNYIYVFSPDAKEDRKLSDATEQFIINRLKYTPSLSNQKETDMKTIDEVRPVSSVADLKKFFTIEEIENMRKLFELDSDEALV